MISMMALSATAIFAARHSTTCGVDYIGPGIAYFDNFDDYYDYQMTMDQVICNW